MEGGKIKRIRPPGILWVLMMILVSGVPFDGGQRWWGLGGLRADAWAGDRPEHAHPQGEGPVSVEENRVLDLMRRLLQEGRPAEAYQLGRVAADDHQTHNQPRHQPRHQPSGELLLAVAYAALAIGQCDLAMGHLARLRGRAIAPGQARRMDRLVARCRGPWRRRVVIGMTAGYRQSLVDRERDVRLRLQPGSALHGLCGRFRGLCDPDATYLLRGRRASGVDIWSQLALRHLYRDGGPWDAEITPVLFFRTPQRSGYDGRGAGLRLAFRRHLAGGRHIDLTGETGAAHFRQGTPRPAIAQTYRLFGAGFVMPHGKWLASRFGYQRQQVRSQWLDLRRRTNDYRLMIMPAFIGAGPGGAGPGGALSGWTLSGWARIGTERSRQTGPGMMPGSKARLAEAGVGLAMTYAQLRLYQRRRDARFSGTLPHLAAPHRARTRVTGVDLSPVWRGAHNLKVVLSLENRKISSPDPYRPESTKNLTLTIKYDLSDTP